MEEQLLEHRWRKWIAENKMLKVEDSTVVAILGRNGLPQGHVQNELRSVAGHPYFEAGANLVQLGKKLESILGVRRQLAAMSPEAGRIGRLPGPDATSFLRRFYCTNTPVVLTNLMDGWKAMSAWTPEYLKAKLSDVEVEVQVGRDADPLFERNLDRHRKRMPFAHYVDMVMNAGVTNDFYMVANNKNLDRSGMSVLLEDVVFPEYFDGQQARDKVFFWFGPAGTVTPLHHDPMNVALAQIQGRKRVGLISPDQTPLLYNYTGVFSEVDVMKPDLDRYPLFKQVRPIEFILEPGEILFIPVGWWHYVTALDKSISVSMTNFVFPNAFSWQDPQLYR